MDNPIICIINMPNPTGKVSSKDVMGGFGALFNNNIDLSLPPIDLPYVGGLLRKNKIKFKIIDCLGYEWNTEDLLRNLSEISPSIIAVRTSTSTFEWDISLTEIIKRYINCKIVFFGTHVSVIPEQVILRDCVDIVVIGEPELTILDICTKNIKDCNGIWYKNDGKIIKNEYRPYLENLDILPFPSWDIMPYYIYGSSVLEKPFVTMKTSRGCSNNCGYCPYPLAQGRKIRLRSVKNVIEEFEYLYNILNVKTVMIRDPDFAFYKDRTIKICNELINRNIKLSWICETRIEHLDEELISLMSISGCIEIKIGIENANDSVLKNVNRRAIHFKNAKHIINLCRKHNIKTQCFFILGLPGESQELAYNTIKYVINLDADVNQVAAATPFHGTKLRNWAENNHYIENTELTNITGYEATMRNEYMSSDEIRSFQYFGLFMITYFHSIRRVIHSDIMNKLIPLDVWIFFHRKFPKKMWFNLYNLKETIVRIFR